jgi:hypothetical protein
MGRKHKDDSFIDTQTNDERIEDLENRYSDIAAAGPKKQNPWLQGAFMALQALAHVANPEDQRPIQWLGNAKYQYNLGQIRDQLGPLYDARYRQKTAGVPTTRVPIRRLVDSPPRPPAPPPTSLAPNPITYASLPVNGMSPSQVADNSSTSPSYTPRDDNRMDMQLDSMRQQKLRPLSKGRWGLSPSLNDPIEVMG